MEASISKTVIGKIMVLNVRIVDHNFRGPSSMIEGLASTLRGFRLVGEQTLFGKQFLR